MINKLPNYVITGFLFFYLSDEKVRSSYVKVFVHSSSAAKGGSCGLKSTHPFERHDVGEANLAIGFKTKMYDKRFIFCQKLMESLYTR